ncbi:hypothetical protein BKA82DRAFT_4199214 [Pisolithus tinctorius]|nr:hypothetical protein BKA82DRAFT_4199214 [Pisolithus tinctorius]
MKKDVDAKTSGASIKWNGAKLFMSADESMVLARTIGLRWSFGLSGSDAQSPVDEDYPFLPFLFGYASQSGHKWFRPKTVHDNEVVDEFAKDYTHFASSLSTPSVCPHMCHCRP